MKFFATLALATLVAVSSARNCGFKIAPCPADEDCIPVSQDCTDLHRCLGVCTPKEYQPCGGFRPEPQPDCPKGTTCRDDPRVPGCGLACDQMGICIPDDAPPCEGFAGFVCPKGLDCYDLPNDECDPRQGGNDCIGVCLRPRLESALPYEEED